MLATSCSCCYMTTNTAVILVCHVAWKFSLFFPAIFFFINLHPQLLNQTLWSRIITALFIDVRLVRVHPLCPWNNFVMFLELCVLLKLINSFTCTCVQWNADSLPLVYHFKEQNVCRLNAPVDECMWSFAEFATQQNAYTRVDNRLASSSKYSRVCFTNDRLPKLNNRSFK